MTEQETSEKLDLLERMFQPDFDWAAWWEDHDVGADDVFRECYRWHDYSKGNRPFGTVDCGGIMCDDTPRALYRICFLAKPAIDFGDMYKTGSMVDLCSPDYRFVASVQLWKYEVGVYFFCPPDLVAGTPHGVQAGRPSADNGVRCGDAFGNRWFELLGHALAREWDVYPGNNFRV